MYTPSLGASFLDAEPICRKIFKHGFQSIVHFLLISEYFYNYITAYLKLNDCNCQGVKPFIQSQPTQVRMTNLCLWSGPVQPNNLPASRWSGLILGTEILSTRPVPTHCPAHPTPFLCLKGDCGNRREIQTARVFLRIVCEVWWLRLKCDCWRWKCRKNLGLEGSGRSFWTYSSSNQRIKSNTEGLCKYQHEPILHRELKTNPMFETVSQIRKTKVGA